MLRGAEIVWRCMQAEEVVLMFAYPGGTIMVL